MEKSLNNKKMEKSKIQENNLLKSINENVTKLPLLRIIIANLPNISRDQEVAYLKDKLKLYKKDA